MVRKAKQERKHRQKGINDLGVIRADEVYPIAVFQQRAGLGDWAMRQLRRRGFPVTRVGNGAFVSGADFLRFLHSGKNGA